MTDSIDDLPLGADGFLDMDAFAADDTDLGGEALADLRATLHADPVDEPTVEEWDAMFETVVAGDDGPFGLDGDLLSDPVDLDDGAAGADDVFAVDDLDTDVDPDDIDDIDDLDTEVDPDDLGGDDGDGGDLFADDGGPDDDGGGIVEDLDDGGLGLDDVDTGDIGDFDIDVDLDGGLDAGPATLVDDGFDVGDVEVEAPADISHDFEDTL